jgi:CxxC motif-containing protein (DUF1111 family)
MSLRKSESMRRFLAPVGLLVFLSAVPIVYAAVEAPAGIDNQTNGFESQTQLDLDRAQFENRDEIADGLGPIYNAQGCSECHQSPVSGSVSQITEQRAGNFDGTTFTPHPGGSLINDRGIQPGLHEMVSASDNVRTLRVSLSILGDGFVEAIPDSEFTRIQSNQSPGMVGTIVYVPVLEAPGTTRIGRFGWKNQHASLLSFSADAYLNEVGITSPLQPNENTMDGQSLVAFDTVPDPEDAATPDHPFGPDIEAFTRFMRSTKAPSSVSTPSPGMQVFVSVGCSNCHTITITTAPAGASINGGTFVVPPALGDKIIHPYSDFMLHDIGTGDGIDQGGGPATRNKVRTAPLWGLKNRSRLLHTGETLTIDEAIRRHGGEALPVIQNYLGWGQGTRDYILQFLMSL